MIRPPIVGGDERSPSMVNVDKLASIGKKEVVARMGESFLQIS